MQLTYTFDINDDICESDSLHRDLDYMVTAAGFEVTKSTLESDDEVTEHDYQEGANEDA